MVFAIGMETGYRTVKDECSDLPGGELDGCPVYYYELANVSYTFDYIPELFGVNTEMIYAH